MGFFDSLGEIFSSGGGEGGGGGGGLGNFLASLATAGLGAYSSMANNDAALEQRSAEQQFSAAEAEKQRQAEMQMLMMRLANQGGGGGAGSAAAMENVKRQRIADLVQSKLQGVQNNQNALRMFLDGVQAPYLRLMGR